MGTSKGCVVAQRVYALMQVAGLGGKDFSSVYRFLEAAGKEEKECL